MKIVQVFVTENSNGFSQICEKFGPYCSINVPYRDTETVNLLPVKYQLEVKIHGSMQFAVVDMRHAKSEGLTNDEIMAIMMHEVGHAELSHDSVTRSTVEEIEADAYAAERGYRSAAIRVIRKTAISDVKKLKMNYRKLLRIDDAWSRIKALKKL